ncbi:MAG: hypothetical protein MJK12_13325 [Colwellia sp.]|nr:hypothetical protein [Colwellia sp.]
MIRVLMILLTILIKLSIQTSFANNYLTQNTHADLELHNPYGAKNVVSSSHFSYWYSDEFIGQESIFKKHLAFLEVAWHQQIKVNNYRASANTYKVNVYLEQAGILDPPFAMVPEYVWGSASYDQYPQIIFNRIALAEDEFQIKKILAHEFFHAVTWGYANHQLQTNDWFIEASANWAAVITHQDRKHLAVDLSGLAQGPGLSIHHVQSTGGESPERRHPYSMAIFLDYLAGDDKVDIIKRVYEHLESNYSADAQNIDSLGTLKNIAENEFSINFNDLFARFTAKNILWDYEEQYYLLATLQDQGVSQNARYLASHTTVDNAWQYPSKTGRAGLPHNWGAAYLHVNSETIDSLEFSFYPETKNEYTQWQVTLVTTSPDNQYQSFDLNQDGTLTAQFIDLKNINEFWLSVSVTGSTTNYTTRHKFAYQFAELGKSTKYTPPIVIIDPDIGEDTSGGSMVILSMLLTFLVIYRQKLV